MKKCLFITGTRADYGKIKPLLNVVKENPDTVLLLFVTGMHMLSKYGNTYHEIEKDGFINNYLFINQRQDEPMDLVLSNTVRGISNFVAEKSIDLMFVHGDRLEALAGAIVGAFNNIRVVHIEGGEVSGTIDESIRHSVSKLSHIHLVANTEAKKRLEQLGENKNTIHVIGSPDIDVMLSSNLPTLSETKRRYDIPFSNYSILMYHPVTTEKRTKLKKNVSELINALIESNQNYIVIHPNNDSGSDIIFDEYNRIKHNENFVVYPSIKFEYFLTLLKNSNFIIGNSSAGIREAGIYGVPSVDVGSRQMGRYNMTFEHISHCDELKDHILNAIYKAQKKQLVSSDLRFGNGNSAEKFRKLLSDEVLWQIPLQKKFIDVE